MTNDILETIPEIETEKEKPMTNNILETIPETETETELDALRTQVSELAGRLDRLNAHDRRVLLAEEAVADAETRLNECKQAAKEAKEAFDEAVATLRHEIRTRDGQGELPFPDDSPDDPEASAVPPLAEDLAGKTLLGQIGVTAAQAEKLAALDPAVETVAQLEALIAAGGFVPGRIKGLGETAINKISDRLMEFRSANPNPNEARPELIEGEWDAAQYRAGQIARADGDERCAPPMEAGTHAFQSWTAGWQAKDDELAAKSRTKVKPSKKPQSDAEYANELIDEIRSLAESVPEEAEDFAASVSEKTEDIAAWVEEHGHASDLQIAALENMRDGLAKWIRD